MGVYVSNEQNAFYSMTLNVRTGINALTTQRSIREAIHSVDKNQALGDVRTVEQIKDQSLATNRLQSVLMGIFGTVALRPAV